MTGLVVDQQSPLGIVASHVREDEKTVVSLEGCARSQQALCILSVYVHAVLLQPAEGFSLAKFYVNLT